jgi:UDP-3-O-[3-hydroxymyristoyl] N-acetylglucosamine deacetylase/3-hydroxyacyl-[acyl-carrier-protein] dehydratase
VDRVIELVGFHRAVGLKNVSFNEPYFQGHWPGQPIMPGVLQVEALAQLSGVLLLRRLQNTGKVAVLLSIDRIKFRRPVVPGDQVRLECETLSLKSRSGRVLGRATVNDELTCEAKMKFMLMDA